MQNNRESSSILRQGGGYYTHSHHISKTLIWILLTSLLSIVNGQSSYIYQAVPTHQLLQDLTFDMGAVKKTDLPGFELNFWVMPYFLAVGVQMPIVTVCDGIDITMGYDSVNNYLGLGMNYQKFSQNGTFKNVTSTIWVNVNLRVLYGSYVLLNAWQGNNWYQLSPTQELLYLVSNTSDIEGDSSLRIRNTSNQIGAWVADFRVFNLNQSLSWGEFLRHYEDPFNSVFNQTINYIFIRNSQFNLMPASQISYDVSPYTLKVLDVLRCNASMAMQADGTCSMNCLTSKCLFCQTVDSDYYNICRYCDGQSSSCQPISTCPVGYYLDHGICYQCPIGCNSCTASDLCTSCGAGLILNQVKNQISIIDSLGMTEYETVISSATCDCPIGQFGTVDPVLLTVTCSACDSTCYTCAQTNVQCTACSTPLFLIDIDGGMCINNCPVMLSNYYGDPTDNTCKPCADNCLTCDYIHGCTQCGNYNATEQQQQQQTDSNGVPQFDITGQPIMITVNITVSKKLLNAQGICMESCPTNSIDNSTYFACAMCPSECNTCSNFSSNCTSCNITQSMSLYTVVNNSFTPPAPQSSCVPSCPDGFYSDQGVCKPCDVSCSACQALNYCTNCTLNYTSDQLYYFENYQCKASCGDMFYPDNSNPDYLFCRSCPSNCNTCTSISQCTTCLQGYYLTTIGIYQLCVQPTSCAPGSYPDQPSGLCLDCISNCMTCVGNADCEGCMDGYFLYQGACISRCPTGTYAEPTGSCVPCISNCDVCEDTLTCQQCHTGNVLLEDLLTCIPGVVCPTGYYSDQQNNCTLCAPECYTCNSLVSCTACILGYSLKGTTCLNNCGNGIRELIEYCDDGNNVNGDGCASDCTVEPGFTCEQGVLQPGQTTAPDTCRCDPIVMVAEWMDYWGTISITFGSVVYFNSTGTQQSQIPLTFCQQILDPGTVAKLGTAYACYLSIGSASSQLIIEVGNDAVIGNLNDNYTTEVDLIEGAMLVTGCDLTGIPIHYQIMNIPLDTPLVLLTSNQGTSNSITSVPTSPITAQFAIGLCSTDFTINLSTSKGLTKRIVTYTWNTISLMPADDNMKQTIQQALDQTYTGSSFYTISETYIEMLQDKNVSIQTVVTNFLGFQSKNTTNLYFLNSKQVAIIDLPDSVTFQLDIPNTLFPRFRLPYCQADSTATISTDYQQLSYACDMFDVALTTKVWPLYNCTIPANNMTLLAQYIVQVTVYYNNEPSYTAYKNVIIQPTSPPVQLSLIQGCNRVFSPNSSFVLEAIYNTNPNTTTFVWQCTDKATGSVCFSTSYQYITLGNSDTITVAKDIFFFGMQYDFQVTAFDSSSNTNDTISCSLYSSGAEDQIIDVYIIGEATQTGYIDFTRQETAFKAYIYNLDFVMQSNLSYQWTISDSAGNILQPNQISIYQNSIGVQTSQLNRNALYSIFVNVTDGVSWGNATQTLRTEPDISCEFHVEPGDTNQFALTTVWSLSVTSQRTFDTLNTYVFGYVDPNDGITQIAMTKRGYLKFVQLILPVPTKGSTITCYVEVVMPNGVSMTYYQTVTVYNTDLTIAQFVSDSSTAVVDSILESMQIKHKLVSLGPRMTTSQKVPIILLILQGLQSEPTPLSDYYIQASAGSLLLYISQQTDCITASASVVNQAAAIFNQITIGENVNLTNGQALKFGASVTQSLFNFANNIFQKDLTSVIGGPTQLSMKVMFLQGLKNVLKGSLSNMILGNAGGFFYQGQNISAKAVKFDTFEKNYTVNSSLPNSISGKFSQNFVNISLPLNLSSNPCSGYPACQISIIILDTPITAFISNDKDAILMSMLVDLTVSSTEVTSPNPTIAIQDLTVQNLYNPILMTIPLNKALDTSSPNNTLGCGYIDPADEIFKMTGVGTYAISNSLVTCQASHLTSIGVEQYSAVINSTSSSSNQDTNSTSSSSQSLSSSLQINMWASWAVYACFAVVGLTGLGVLLGRKLDAKDEINLTRIKQKQKKIYVNLFLEPIAKMKKAPVETKSKKPIEVYQKVNQQVDETIRVVAPDTSVKKEPAKEDFFDDLKAQAGINPVQMSIVIGDDVISQSAAGSKRSVKKKIKKKKKKVVDQIENDLFFEGGDDDDFFSVAEAEESKKSKGKKKKKKKSTLPSIERVKVQKFEEVLDTEGAQSQKSGRGRSMSKGEDADVQSRKSGMNSSNFGGFNFNENDEQRSKKSKNSSRSKSKGKKRRSASRKLNIEGDQEAQELKPKKLNDQQKNHEKVAEMLGDYEEINADNVSEANHSQASKGFETLMNEELEKAKNEIGKKKKRAAMKKSKEEKKKKDYYEKEAANCVQFCIWNCRDAHRCTSLFKFYNIYLSRASRFILLGMSWLLIIMITGYLVTAGNFYGPKSANVEQVICGAIAAGIARIWVVLVTGFMLHTKREKVYEEIQDPDEAKQTVCLDQVRYYFALILVLIATIITFVKVFSFSSYYTSDLLSEWMWMTMFGILADPIVVEGVFISLATVFTMTIGASPDSFGRCRNCFLPMVPQAIKERAE